MSQRARWLVIILDASVDIGGFKDSNQNWKLTFTVDFSQEDHLVVGQLGNDDPGELHLDRHRTSKSESRNKKGTDAVHASVPTTIPSFNDRSSVSRI